MRFKRLRDLREDHDLSQRDVAKILNLSQTGYGKYETGDNEISVTYLIRLADFYNVSLDYIVGRSDNRNIK